jgi:hypothetical protein
MILILYYLVCTLVGTHFSFAYRIITIKYDNALKNMLDKKRRKYIKISSNEFEKIKFKNSYAHSRSRDTKNKENKTSLSYDTVNDP